LSDFELCLIFRNVRQRLLFLRYIARDIRFQFGNLAQQRFAIDLEQNLTRLHILSRFKAHLRHLSRDAGLHIHGRNSLYVSDARDVERNIFGHRRNNPHRHHRHLSCLRVHSILPATAAQQQDNRQ
jgi:hypothetical protein